MKNLKIFVLLFGILGLVSLFLPMSDEMPSMFSMLNAFDKTQLIIVLAGFGLPTAMGAMGLAKPPFQMWQGIVALAGFGLMAVKTHVWEIVGQIGAAPMSSKLMIVAILGGVVVSLLATIKPEKA